MQGSWDYFWKRHNLGAANSWAKRRMVAILSDYVRPGLTVLDAGCGTGFFSSYFISCGCNVYSLDYSKGALAISRKVTGNNSRMYINGDILDRSTLSNIDSRFDIIFTDGLLEHYSKDEQDRIIKNMEEVKEVGGHMINFVPNRFSLWSLIRPFYMDIRESPFVMREFLDLHLRNGLMVISCGGLNVLPFRSSPEGLLGRYVGMLFYCVAV